MKGVGLRVTAEDSGWVVLGRALPASCAQLPPLWSRVEGKYSVNFQGILSDSGSILRGVQFWDVPFDLMLSPGWCTRAIEAFAPAKAAALLAPSEWDQIVFSNVLTLARRFKFPPLRAQRSSRPRRARGATACCGHPARCPTRRPPTWCRAGAPQTSFENAFN